LFTISASLDRRLEKIMRDLFGLVMTLLMVFIGSIGGKFAASSMRDGKVFGLFVK